MMMYFRISHLDLRDLLELGLGVLVRDEDLDDVSGRLLGGRGQLGNAGAGLLGVELRHFLIEYIWICVSSRNMDEKRMMRMTLRK